MMKIKKQNFKAIDKKEVKMMKKEKFKKNSKNT